MQNSTVVKGVIVLALIVASTRLASSSKRGGDKNDSMESFRHNLPRTCLFDYINSFLKKHGSKDPEWCRQACRYFMNDKAKRNVQNSKKIEIKVRLFKPWEPGYTVFPWSRPANIVSQDGLESIMDFKKSLGPQAELIRDTKGFVIGISLNDSPPTPSIHAKALDFLGPSRAFRHESNTIMGSPKALKGDQDQCCTTLENFFTNHTLVDVMGNSYSLIQYSNAGSYQFIRHGVCGGQGRCRGRCVQQYVNMALSVYPPEDGQKATYKFFSIPGYCSCKTFG